ALVSIKNVLPDTPVFANTGVRESNVDEQLSVADGAVVGTTFKVNNHIWNAVDEQRVKRFMDKVNAMRAAMK
ncbi:MAG: BtpA/SgcQ family protein, partial [Anaerolineales bacterium]